jgi:hypothetical protein
LWAIFIFLLPFTSLRLLSRLVGGSEVAPASFIPLVLLLAVWFVPYLMRRGALPLHSLPVMGFTLFAVLASTVSLFMSIPSFKDAPLVSNTIQAIATLFVGLAFYLVSATWISDEKRLSATLRWINYGGMLILFYSLVQALASHFIPFWPRGWRYYHHFFSVGTLYSNRVVGFALEPSWLANQLNMLYLPLWLGASALRFSAHRWRLFGISLENVLLVGGAAMLFLSKSRLGLLAFLLCVAFLLIMASYRITGWLHKRWPSVRKWVITAGFYFSLALLAITILLGIGYWMSKTDFRMTGVFDLNILLNKPFIRYAEQLDFAPRMVYWGTGWTTFNDHPLLGVGLGNAGYFFPNNLSYFGFRLMEVRDYMYRLTSLPNLKSLWVRILAETGIVGFAFWITWLYVLLRTARSLFTHKNKLMRLVGLAGLLTLIAMLLEGFSMDTFALPYFWVTFGVLTAAFTIASKQKQVDDQNLTQ